MEYTKQDRLLKSDPRVDGYQTIENATAELQIYGIQKNCAYGCYITDLYGTQKYLSYQIKVDNGFSIKAGESETGLETVAAIPGEEVALKVYVEAEDREDLEYAWTSTYNYSLGTICEEDTLNVTGTGKAARYECRVTDKYGNSGTVFFYVEVDNRFLLFGKNLESQTINVDVPYGEKVVLDLDVVANDSEGITYEWWKGEMNPILPVHNPYKTIETEPIMSPMKYACIARDKYGSIRSVIFNICVDNHFNATDDETGLTTVTRYIRKGEDLDITLQLTGDDLAGLTYTWYAGSNEISCYGDSSSLHLDNIKEPFGVYYSAFDKYGTYKTVSYSIEVLKDAVYSWSDDYSSLTATARLVYRAGQYTETVEPRFEVITEPTCNSEGIGRYIASFESGLFDDQTIEVSIPKADHDYTLDSWYWSEDRTSVIAKFVCSRDSSHVIYVPADITEKTVLPSCEEEGQKTLTATVSYGGKEYSDSKTTPIDAIGHKWGDWVYDANTSTETRVCANDASHVETIAVTPVTKVSLNKTSLNMICGDSADLTVEAAPSNATDKTIIWTSSNKSVATVKNGKVTAVGAGTVTITAAAKKGSNSAKASCTVKVQCSTPALASAANVADGVKVTWAKSTGAEKYRVFRRTGSGSWQKLGDTTSLTYTDTTAVSGTTYNYTVRCVTGDGKSYTSGYDDSGKTIKYIAAPALKSASSVADGVKVTWAKSEGAEKYRVFRRTGSGSWQKLGDTTSLTYTDTAAVSGTTYSYTVRCVTGDGKNYASGYDDAGKTVKYIAAPALKSASSVADGVKVTWVKSEGAENYRVFRKTGSNSWQKVADTTDLTYTDTTAVSGTTYSYTVRCVTSDGKSYASGYDDTGKTVKYIAAPAVKSATNAADSVKVTWAKSEGAEKYRVFRRTGSGSWQKLGDTTSLTYTDTTAVSGTTYSYTVRCVTSDGKSYASGYDDTGKTVKYIAAPTLKAVSNVTGGVKVTWAKSEGAEKYRVFRRTGSGSWQKIADTVSLTYTDTAAVSGTTYSYTVRCVTSDGKSYASGYDDTGKKIKYISAPTLKSASNDVDGVKVTWAKSEGAEKYRVFRKAGSGSWQKIADTTSLTFTDTTAVSGTTYSYTVRCVTSDGKSYASGYDDTGKMVGYIASPKLQSVSNTSDGIKVTWARSEGAEKYRVFRKTGSGSWQKLADTTTLIYTDTTAVSGTKYTYTVRCITSDGSSYTSAYDTAGLSITKSTIVYYTPTGKSYHLSSTCATLNHSKTILSGTLEEAAANGKTDPCNVCAGGH